MSIDEIPVEMRHRASLLLDTISTSLTVVTHFINVVAS